MPKSRVAGLSWRPVVLMDTSGWRRRTTTTKAAVSDDTSQESRPHEQGSSWDGGGPPAGRGRGSAAPPRSSITAGASVKVPVDQHQRGHQGPHVQGDADPAGADLHPHGGPPAAQVLAAGVGAAGTQDTPGYRDWKTCCNVHTHVQARMQRFKPSSYPATLR